MGIVPEVIGRCTWEATKLGQHLTRSWMQGKLTSRLQKLHVAPGATVFWTFGAAKGEVKADAQGCVTVPGLKITAEPTTLSVRIAK